MHKLSWLIGGALVAHAFTFSAVALAQEPGAGTPKPAPYAKVSPADKAEGKAHRKEEGRAAAMAGSTTGEGERPPAPQVKVARQDREVARSARKAETARAAKAGEIKPIGEVGPAK